MRTIRRRLMAALLLPGIVGCQQIRQTEKASQLNPHPQQAVRITGRIPPSLEIRMFALYSIDRIHTRTGPAHTEVVDEACRPTLKFGMIPIDPGEYSRSEELKIERNGDRYETRFVVDRYLPGRCGWQFDSIGTAVAKDGKRSEAVTLQTQTVFKATSASTPNCDPAWNDACPSVGNSDPTPVIVRCEMYASKESGKRPSLMCQGYEKIPYKKTHYVTPQTKEMAVDFYDVALEPDPIQPSERSDP